MKWEEKRKEIKHIKKIFKKNGLGYLFNRFLFRRKRFPDRGKKLKDTLVELGTIYIKLGQFYSSRYDLLPIDITEELNKLIDKQPPISYIEFIAMLYDIYGDPDKLFSDIEKNPIASSSISQIHRATLKDGTEVIIKIRKPGIVKKLKADAEVLQELSKRIGSLPFFKTIDFEDTVKSFLETLKKQYNLLNELKSIEEFKCLFCGGDLKVYTPVFYSDLCKENVLIEDYIPGISFLDLIEMPEKDLPFRVDKKEILNTIARRIFKQIFCMGLVQPNPNAADFIITSKNEIYYLQAGTTTRIDKQTRIFLLEFFTALVRRDFSLLTSVIEESFAIEESDIFRDQMKNMFSRYYGSPVSEIKVSKFIASIFSVIRNHGVKVPEKLLYMVSSVLVLEEMSQELDPTFNTLSFLKNYLLKENLWDIFKDQLSIIKDEGKWNLLLIQRRLGELGKIISGKNRLHFKMPRLGRLLTNFTRAFNSIAVAIIIAALLLSIQNFKNPFIPYTIVFGLALYIIYELISSQRNNK